MNNCNTLRMYFVAMCESSAQPVIFQVPSAEVTVLDNCIPPAQPAASVPNACPPFLCIVRWSPCGNFIAASCGMNCIAVYDTVRFKCRYVRLPEGYVVTSLSWGCGSCFFVVTVQHRGLARDEDRVRSGILMYRFNDWHSGWHLDKLKQPTLLLHTGLWLPDGTNAETDGISEWNDSYLLCPDNYPLCEGRLHPLHQQSHRHTLVVHAQLDPSSCRLYVAFANAGLTHVAA